MTKCPCDCVIWSCSKSFYISSPVFIPFFSFLSFRCVTCSLMASRTHVTWKKEDPHVDPSTCPEEVSCRMTQKVSFPKPPNTIWWFSPDGWLTHSVSLYSKILKCVNNDWWGKDVMWWQSAGAFPTVPRLNRANISWGKKQWCSPLPHLLSESLCSLENEPSGS